MNNTRYLELRKSQPTFSLMNRKNQIHFSLSRLTCGTLMKSVQIHLILVHFLKSSAKLAKKMKNEKGRHKKKRKKRKKYVFHMKYSIYSRQNGLTTEVQRYYNGFASYE